MAHPTIPSIPLLAVLVLAGVAEAQLDLPDRPGGATPPAGEPGTRREAEPNQGERGGLDLPRRTSGDLAPGSEERGGLVLPTGSGAGEPAVLPQPPPGLGPHAAARLFLEALEQTNDHESTIVETAYQGLVELGPAGLAAARVGLASEHAPTLWVSARFIVTYGGPEERAALAERLRHKVPAKLAGALLRLLVQSDPTLATPKYLAELLDHRIGSMRAEASHMLKARVEGLPFPTLVSLMDSSRSSTRSLALQLLSLVPDPASVHVIAKSLGDEHARVASTAASLLARLESGEVSGALRARAFGDERSVPRGAAFPPPSPFSSRERAYALLSLVEREQNRGQVLMGDEDVPALLAALDAREPALVGAASVALAGIGFRSSARVESRWLDREVPHLLVRFGTGVEFHPDLSSLIQPASERLALLSGENFGLDGRAWRAWWVANAEGFEARRGALPIAESEISSIELTYDTGAVSSPEGGGRRRYHGPAVAIPEDEGNLIYLTSAEASELVALLRTSGVLGAERLGDGTLTGARRVLALCVGSREKTLSFEAGRSVSWLEDIERRLERLDELHVWQAYRDESKYRTRRAFWEDESRWWSEATPRERSRGLKQLLLKRLLSPRPEGRGTFARLVALYGEIGVPEAVDFPAFLQLLDHEALWNARARQLFELARTAAESATEQAAREEGARIDPARGGELLDAVCLRFDRAAQKETLVLLEELGRARVREAAGDPEPELRRLAALALASSKDSAEWALAMGLCGDPEISVAEAALRALGRAHVEEARGLFEERLVAARPRERAAAMVALGHLGGEGVGERALEMLAERDPNLQRAATEALAELADPDYASLLSALFSRGPDSLLFEPARRGLRRLGADSHSELLRLTRSRNAPARRAATLLLAEQGVPEAASLLMTFLTENPGDQRVLGELSVLSCVDFTREGDPVDASWDWWDEVVHTDSLLWLLAAAERQGFSTPGAASLEGRGNAAGARFLASLVARAIYPLNRRAARELETRLGREVEPPRFEDELPLFLEELEETIQEVYER